MGIQVQTEPSVVDQFPRVALLLIDLAMDPPVLPLRELRNWFPRKVRVLINLS